MQLHYATNYFLNSTETALHLVLSNYLTRKTIYNYTVHNFPLA